MSEHHSIERGLENESQDTNRIRKLRVMALSSNNSIIGATGENDQEKDKKETKTG